MMLRLLTCLMLFSLGCGSDSDAEQGTSDEDAGDEPTPPLEEPDASGPPEVYRFPCLEPRTATHTPSFESIYLDIFCHTGCANLYCHGSRAAWQGLDLSSIEGGYAQLVGKPTGQSVPLDMRATCRESSLLRVEPFAPERSLLFLKVSGMAPCGTRMPPPSGGFDELTSAQIDQVRQWILLGAPLFDPDGGVDGAVQDGAADRAADDAGI